MEPHPRTGGGRAGCRNRTLRTLEEFSPAPDCPARRLGGARKRVRKSSARCKRRILRPPWLYGFFRTRRTRRGHALLREYQTKLGVLINKFEGTVERFSGDGLLVVFNDPLPCPDASMRAVRMALEALSQVESFRARYRLWRWHCARLCNAWKRRIRGAAPIFSYGQGGESRLQTLRSG